MRYIVLAVLFLCTLGVIVAQSPPKAKYDMKDVFVHDGKLIVEGKEFYIKGFNYSPQPRGMKGILANDGGGLCSVRKNSQGVPQSACYLEDYFDGNIHPEFPDHGPWFQQIWDRDFALMQEMGVNAIRVYHMHYITKSLIDKYPKLYSNHFRQFAPEHRTFFDVAHKYGIKIICPVVDTETVLSTTSIDELKRFAEARVDEVGDHPALLMWAVGNELGLYAKPQLREIVNQVMDHLREYTLQKWNRIVPVTTVEVDSPVTYIRLMNEMRVDLFTSNCGYRDVHIDSIFDVDVNPDNNMPGWNLINQHYGIPLLVGEYGMHDQDVVTEQRPDWVNQQLKSMMISKEKGGVGFLYFEWNEEHLKPPNQVPMGVVRFEVNSNEKGDSMTDGVLLADKAIKKPVIFEAATSGHPGSPSAQYNYQADIYALTGTTQLTLNLDTLPVKPFPTKITTPPTIPGFDTSLDTEASFTCFGISSTDAAVCSNGQGYCIANDFCSCKDGYSGDNCQTLRTCFGKRFDADNVCSAEGSCTSQDSCACYVGRTGNECQTIATCFGVTATDPTVCSAHGVCTAMDSCVCDSGRDGNNCERVATPPAPSPSPSTPSPSPGTSPGSPSTSTSQPGNPQQSGEPAESSLDGQIDRSEFSSSTSARWSALLIGLVLIVLITYWRG